MKKFHLKPTSKRVVVEPLEEENKVGDIFIVSDTKNASAKGVVMSVNSEILDVKEGNIVTYKSWGGFEVNLNGKKYVILNEDEVIAKNEQKAKKTRKKT